MWVASIAELPQQINSELATIISNSGPLSTLLRAKYPNLYVTVLQQTLVPAAIHEQINLNICEAQSFIREILISSDTKALVQARVVAPLQTYQYFKEILDNLGDKLLGETLLYKSSYLRSDFEYSLIAGQAARRSIFNIQNFKLLVQETFVLY